MRRTRPFLMIELGALLLFATVGGAVYGRALRSPEAAPIPDSLAGFALTERRFGPSAVSEIGRLHGRSFLLTSGISGTHGQAGQATLWVSGASAEWMDANLTRAMQENIATSGSPSYAARRANGGGKDGLRSAIDGPAARLIPGGQDGDLAGG